MCFSSTSTTEPIEAKILLTGYIPYEDIPAFLNGSDAGLAFVPITRAFDIQPPRKTVDYLACGLPVVATDTAGNRKFIKEGVNGFLVKDEPGELASAMEKLMKREGLYCKMANNASNSVRNYSYDRIVNSIVIPAYQKHNGEG